MQNPFPRMAAKLLLAALASVCLVQAQSAQTRAKVSPACPKYLATATVTGLLEIPGTDDLADLGDEWNRGFQGFQPDAGISFQAKLDKDIVKLMVEGAAMVGVTAREFTPDETKAFQAKFGYMPMRFPICLDANLVYVHKDNPLASISMEQLDAIYSKSRLGGGKAPLLHWSDLGVKGDLGKREIHAYARQASTATSSAFANTVMLKGEFRPGIIEKEDSPKLADAILTDPAGIAFGSLSAWYTANKVLPVVPYQGAGARFPNQDNITESRYPMPRLYYVYVNRAPGKALEPLVSEALHYVLSAEGQNNVADVGFLPGPVEFLTIALKRLDR